MESGRRYRTLVPDLDFWKGMVPCQAACPARTDAGRYVQLISEGKFEDAYLTARSPNPFASICGRVCAAPCEDRCRRGVIDAPVAIRALKRFVCEQYGPESSLPHTQEKLLHGESEPGNKILWHLPVLTASRRNIGRGQKVAVIGAGPAGLACAHDLAVMGYRATVFEASSIAGGMMVHGIPEFRLARPVLEKEIQSILDLGVELKLNMPLTPQFGLKQLREQGFQAFFLGVGTQGGRDLPIEGSNLDGVIKAIEFLINVNRGYRVTLGKRVVVIGGGFVAFDAARMALRTGHDPQTDRASSEGAMVTALDAARAAVRAGVQDIRMVSLESFQEMPALRSAQGREEFEHAREEGIVFQPQRGPRRFVGESGRVRGVELIGVKRTYDDSGRFAPVYDPAVSETIEADTVILAIGQKADLAFLTTEDGVALNPQGTVQIERQTLATTARGVFAGGDVAFGPRNLIDAVANGKQAALSIDAHLRGTPAEPETRISFSKLPTRTYHMAEDYEKTSRLAPPSIPLERRTGVSEVEADYSEAQAREQAERCLYCHIQTIYDPEKCVLCNRCVDICPEHCLKLVPYEQMGLEGVEESSLRSFCGLLDGQRELSAMIKDDEACIRCGLCAIRCPTDAMTMEVMLYEDAEPAGANKTAAR
jgi:NADPH-dependent glutamate synthase beta subunit-like oxidoreductase